MKGKFFSLALLMENRKMFSLENRKMFICTFQTCTAWPWLFHRCSCSTLRLSEIASCASCASMTYQMKIQPSAFWMEGLLITLKPTGFYSRVSSRDCLKFCELKYEVVTATKVVGEHSPPYTSTRPHPRSTPLLVYNASLGHGPEGLA